jgi:ABC-2 type transport system permease protein
MTLRSLLLVAGNDVRLTVRDRAAFFWMLALPLLLTWIFGQLGAQGGATKVGLTVLDRDGGWLASALTEELTAGSVDLKVLRGTQAEAPPDPTLRWIVIPKGFTEGALAGRQQKLAIETAKNASTDYSRAAEVLVVRAIVRTLGRAAEMKVAGDTMTSQEYDRLRARPPIISLAVETAGHGAAVPSGVALSVPGNLTFFVLMTTVIYGAVFLTIEKREGMIRRQLTLPISRRTLLGGKVLGRILVASIEVAVLLIAGRFLFGLHFGSSPGGLALLLASYGLAVAGISTFLGAVLQTPVQASSVGMLVSLVMAGLGGCWWPSEIMPEWLRTTAHVFPTAWAMDGLHALISFGKGVDAVLVPSAVLALFGLVFALWGASRLR